MIFTKYRTEKSNSIAERDVAKKQFSHPIRASYSKHALHVSAWRRQTLRLICGILFVFGIYYGYYGPYVTIATIGFTETKYIPKEKLEETLTSYLASLQRFPLNQRHILFFSTDVLETALKEKFGIENISGVRSFPNTVHISIHENAALVIAAIPSSDRWHLLTENGNSVKTVYPFELYKELPLLWNDTGKESDHHARVAVTLLKNKQAYEPLFRITYFIMKSETLIEAYTDRGFVIKLSPQNSLEQQIANLEAIVQEFKSRNILPKEYLLLQYGEKVFYR